MAIYSGNIYEAAGGQGALQKRYDVLYEMAQDAGILSEQNRHIIPVGLKTAFARTADLLMRTNFAVAGAADVIWGQPEAEDTVKSRFLDELLGRPGAQKETFGDVLEQAGVAELGRPISSIEESLFQKRYVSQFFDPTVRGMIGLGMDVGLDPLTWMTVVGGAVTIAGRGGSIALSKAGKAAMDSTYRRVVLKKGRDLGLKYGDEVIENLDEFAKLESETVQRLAQKSDWAALAVDDAELHVKTWLQARSERILHRTIESGLRAADPVARSLVDPLAVRFMGVPIVRVSTIAKPVRAGAEVMEGAIRMLPKGDAAIKLFRESAHHIDRVFNRMPFRARQLPAYRAMMDYNFAIRQSSHAVAENAIATQIFGRDLFTKIGQRFDTADWHTLTRAIDNPNEHMASWVQTATDVLGLTEKQSGDIVDNWRKLSDTMFNIEARNQMLGGEQYIKNYILHKPKNLDEVRQRSLEKITPFRGADIADSSRARVYETLDDGIDAGIEYELNPARLMIERMQKHIHAIADDQAMKDAVSLYSRGNLTKVDIRAGHAVSDLMGDLEKKGVLGNITDLERIHMQDLLETTIKENAGAKAVGKAKAAPWNLTRDELRFVNQAGTFEYGRDIEWMMSRVWSPVAKKIIAEAGSENLQKIANHYSRRYGLPKIRVIETHEEMLKLGIPKTDFMKWNGATWQGPKGQIYTFVQPIGQAEFKGAQASQLRRVITLRHEIEHNIDDHVRRWHQSKRAFTPAGDINPAAFKTKGHHREYPYFNVDYPHRGVVLKAISEGKEVPGDVARAYLDDIATLNSSMDRETLELFGRIDDFAGHDKAEELLSRLAGTTGKRRGLIMTEDQKKLRALRPDLQAAFFHESFRRVQNMDQLANLVTKYADELADLSPEAVSKIAEAVTDKMVGISQIVHGQPFVRHTFTRGALKGQKHFLPKGMTDHIINFDNRALMNPELKGLLKLFDAVTNTFKLLVTAPFLPFHVRNFYSNIAAISMRIRLASLSPGLHTTTIKILNGADGTFVTRSGARHTFEAMRSQLRVLDVRPDRFHLAEIASEVGRGIVDVPVLGVPLKQGEKLGRAIENEARALLYIAELDRGQSMADAARIVKEYLFDYGDLSAIERHGFRRIIPFYTWQSKNIRRQVKNILTRPGEVAAQIKPLMAAERGPDAESLPEWVRGDLKLGLESRPGKAATFLTNIDLPINNVDILWRGGLGKTLRENISLFNPIFKAPLEWAFNMDTFTGRAIKGRQWIGRVGPLLDRNLPKWAKDWFELEKIELPSGDQAYKANGTKIWLTFKGIFVSRMMTTIPDIDEFARSFGDGDVVTGAATLLKLLTGMQFREMDASDARRMRLRNNISRLEEILLEKGEAEEFRKVFRRKKEESSFPALVF